MPAPDPAQLPDGLTTRPLRTSDAHAVFVLMATGALGLYERVGMKTCSTWVNRGIDLD